VATDLDTVPHLDAASAERNEPRGRNRRGPAVALCLVAIAAFTLYALLSLPVGGPRVHPDEVRYVIAASSLVEGEGLTLRGEDYGFGPLLALVLAGILRVAGSVDAIGGGSLAQIWRLSKYMVDVLASALDTIVPSMPKL